MRKILCLAILLVACSYAIAQSAKEERNKKAAIAAFKAYYAGDMDAAFKHHDTKVAFSGSGGASTKAVALDSFKMNAKTEHASWKKAFPDYNEEIVAVAADGDYVMLYTKSSGTWKNRLGIWDASGKSFKMSDVAVFKFNDQGKIIEQQHIMPQVALMDQVGEGGEFEMNKAGYALLAQKKFDDAIEVFQMNVKLHPKSSNVYDSLGEAYMLAGKREKAIENYEKSVKLDPENKNGISMLTQLRQ